MEPLTLKSITLPMVGMLRASRLTASSKAMMLVTGSSFRTELMLPLQWVRVGWKY